MKVMLIPSSKVNWHLKRMLNQQDLVAAETKSVEILFLGVYRIEIA